jgi:hypothetical protein
MKGVNYWSYYPYTPLNSMKRGAAPYICRLAPNGGRLELEFIDNGEPQAQHIVTFRKRNEGETIEIPLNGYEAVIDGLDKDAEYEIAVRRSDGISSQTRLVRMGDVPGKVINYLHPEDNCYSFSGKFLCSPCIIRTPSGALLSSMDVFEGNSPQNLTLLFRSDDDGANWRWVGELFPCFWGRMFVVDEIIYMLGVSNEYGDLLIGFSEDDGETWSAPSVLFRGSCNSNNAGCHRAPMPVIEFNGRLWTDLQYGGWGYGSFGDAVVSAPIDSDLMNPENWICSEFFNWKEFNKTLPESDRVNAHGGIEGNITVGRDGMLYNLLRLADGKSLLLKIDVKDPEKAPQFVKVVDMPITASKIDIHYDHVSGYYWTLASRLIHEPRTNRNLLSLMRSRDLVGWEVTADILDARDADASKIAFQYISFFIENEDIYFQSRTAYNGAHNYHDANYATFHIIKNFRELRDVKCQLKGD